MEHRPPTGWYLVMAGPPERPTRVCEVWRDDELFAEVFPDDGWRIDVRSNALADGELSDVVEQVRSLYGTRIVISSPPDRPDLVCEIWRDGEMWMDVSRATGGEWTVHSYPRRSGEAWVFTYREAMDLIVEARRRLDP